MNKNRKKVRKRNRKKIAEENNPIDTNGMISKVTMA